MNWVQSYITLSGLGALCLLVGFFLVISTPWPTTRAKAKEWIQKPVPLAGMICLILSAFFLVTASVSLLS